MLLEGHLQLKHLITLGVQIVLVRLKAVNLIQNLWINKLFYICCEEKQYIDSGLFCSCIWVQHFKYILMQGRKNKRSTGSSTAGWDIFCYFLSKPNYSVMAGRQSQNESIIPENTTSFWKVVELLPWIPQPICVRQPFILDGWQLLGRHKQFTNLHCGCICDQCGLLNLGTKSCYLCFLRQYTLTDSKDGWGLIRLKSWIGLGAPMWCIHWDA